MNSHDDDTPAADLHNRTQLQQAPEATSSDDVNSTSPNFGTFMVPSVPGYPFLSQPQASGEIGRLGDYRVLAKLGEGGMGFVFRAEDPALKRFVALKVMRSEVAAKPLAADRFLREGRAAAGLKSDHVITIYQVGQANGAPFIAMEYLEGIALDEWMKQQKKAVPVPHVLRVVRDTLRGLATAHDKGLIHRDIKPANLWIEKGSARIKVLDFGLTRGMDGNDQMTADGAVVGTPAYMAPEQAAGRPVDPRADLFSVGTVMYQLFLGINPFVRNNMMATMGAVSFDIQPSVIALRPEVPQAYSDYLDRLLAKDPAGRPANARAALAELAAIEKSLQDTAKTLASSSNLPVVSMMAPAAMAMPAQVWGDITDADDTVVRTKISDPETPRKPPSKKLLIGSGLFAFFALLLGGIVIVITNKDGTKTKVEVPDGATVEVQKDGKSVASVGGKKAEVAKAVMDPDRKAAEYVLLIGGAVQVRVDGQAQDIKAVTDLPKAAFTLTVVNLSKNKLITDEGMAAFKGCKDILTLNLGHTQVSDTALAHFRECKNLLELLLEECPLVGDAGLANFKGCQLTSLSLDGNSLITDAGMTNFKECKKLWLLNLRACSQIGDAGLAHIGEFRTVCNINIPGTRVTEKSLAYFQGSDQLHSFGADTDLLGENALAVIASCPNLGVVALSGDNVVRAGLAQFKNCVKLGNMFIFGSRLTNADLMPFKDCTSLVLVQFRQCPQITEAVIEHFANCPELNISFAECPLITDASLEKLAQRKTLKGLYICGTKVTIEGVKKFRAALPECKVVSDFDVDADRKAAEFVFSLGGNVSLVDKVGNITDAKDLPKEPFKILQIGFNHGIDPKISDADLDLFRSLDSVTSFNVQGSITDAGFAKLATFTWVNRLTHLGVISEELTDAAFASAAKFTSLHSLTLQSKRITGSGIAHLKASSIGGLGISQCGLVDAEMVHLKAMPKLGVLTIIGTPIGDAGLKHISDVKLLESLQMQGCGNVTDEGFKHLENCSRLHLLEFGANGGVNLFTGACLKSIGKLNNLSSLGGLYAPQPIEQNKFSPSDADLKHLLNCPNLERLGIGMPDLTDAGLETLSQLKKLKALGGLQGSKVTAAGVKKFRAALPECKVPSDFPE